MSYLPLLQLSAKVTLVDFTVTQVGLEDQLLGKLILKEKHELEEQRQRLIQEVQSYKRKIKQLEDDLLFRLSNSQGNLLDDTELIDILAVTKQTAQDVNERLVTASDTRRSIVAACEEYRPVARRATLLYFLIAEFAVVNCMYQVGAGGGVSGALGCWSCWVVPAAAAGLLLIRAQAGQAGGVTLLLTGAAGAAAAAAALPH